MALIARIKDGIVVNIEQADASWVETNQGVDGFTFVTDLNESNPPYIGLRWDPETGFEQPFSSESIVSE